MAGLCLNFVCTGNICRSPTAHWVMLRKLQEAGLGDRVQVVSSGTHGHEGWGADDRSARVAFAHGYDLSAHRGAALHRGHYEACTLLLALDGGHHEHMLRAAPQGADTRKVRHLMEWATAAGSDSRSAGRDRSSWGLDVPDPYYEDDACFEDVFAMIDAATDGLLAALRLALASPDPAAELLKPAAERGGRAAEVGGERRGV